MPSTRAFPLHNPAVIFANCQLIFLIEVDLQANTGMLSQVRTLPANEAQR